MIAANEMERLHLLPLELPSMNYKKNKIISNGRSISENIKNNNTYSSNGKVKTSFARRLALGCIILAALVLLYVPAYHSAQGPFFSDSSLNGVSIDINYLSSIAQLPGWTFNTSKNINLYIHPENNTTIINSYDLCTTPPYLLVIIFSAVSNDKERLSIRNTWANEDNLYNLSLLNNNNSVKIAFLLGQSDNETLNEMVVYENLKYNDIIQEQFLDTYNNLTLKSVMMLKWITNSCSQANYIMKTDDDMYINLPLLMKSLQSRDKSTGTLIGSLICNAHPISDPNNKWYTPKYMFSEKTYPNYLSGTGYVMSSDVASDLYKAALKTPLLHLEDVYITGLCARKANVHPVNHPGFSYTSRKLVYSVLKYAITMHRVNYTQMYVIHDKLKETNIFYNISSNIDKKNNILNRHKRNLRFLMMKSRSSNRCN